MTDGLNVGVINGGTVLDAVTDGVKAVTTSGIQQVHYDGSVASWFEDVRQLRHLVRYEQ